jgi:SWI/SNF-related matrix-associated actin-dependent regulator 1 of chromatin subfamily A
MSDTNKINILNAVKVLKSVCDGAFKEDAKGFNKPDAYISNNIIALDAVNEVSSEVLFAAYHMLRKYKNQLQNYGVDFESLQEPLIDNFDPDEVKEAIRSGGWQAKRKLKKVESKNSFKIDILDTGLRLSFEYEKEIKNKVKAAGATFEKEKKTWFLAFTPEKLKTLEKELENLGITIEDPVKEIFKNADSYAGSLKKAWLRGEKVAFRFDFSDKYFATIKEVVKAIPSIWNAEEKYWGAKLTKQSAEKILQVVDRYEFKMDEKDLAEIKSVAEASTKNVEMSYAAVSDLVVEGLKGVLKPFQKAGVEFLLANLSAILADEMGLGKTIQTIAALIQQNAFPALIVCPASLKLNWEKEIKKWTDKTVQIVNGKSPEKADFTIVNYESLEKVKDTDFVSVVFDESHKLKNGAMAKDKKTGIYEYKTKCVREAFRVSKNAKVRYLLSGTPMVNRPVELVSQLDILGKIDELGGAWKFKMRYCDGQKKRYGWDFSGATNIEELKANLRKICLIRREKKNVLQELPDKQRQEIPVEISNRSEYNKASTDLIKYLKDRILADKKFKAELFAKKLSSKETADAISERSQTTAEKAGRAEVLVKINTLRQVAGRGKIEAVKDWLESFLETGKKIVLFCHYKESVETLKEELAPMRVLTITGNDNEETRQKNVEEFQNNPESQIILCTLKAGGVGITLTAASDVAFLEVGWTPAELDQAEDRCHRMTQKNAVNAYYFKGVNTIDEKLYALIESKRDVVDLDKTTSVQGDFIKAILDEMDDD